MTNTDLIRRSDRVVAESPDTQWVAGALLIGAITFNAVLCFINTNVAPIRGSYVMGSEVVIIAIALLTCYRTVEPKYVLTAGVLILYTALLAFVRSGLSPEEGMNLKVTRDFLIPIVFLVVGRNFADIKNADRIVFFATGLILLFALFEYFFLDAYLRVFGVLDYYVAKGSLDALDPSLQWSNGLMLNGVRTAEGGGRVLLPFLLEDHRVSSLFLESISLGNFGALVAFWGIIRSRMEGRAYFWSIIAGIILIVLSDNRFNASFLPIGVVFLFASPRLTKPVVMVLPFVAILGLCLIAANAEPQEVPGLDGGSLWDRLVYSGRILLDLDGPNWLGIWPLPPYTLDAGYAYIISSVGLIGLVACWLWFTSLTGLSRYFYAFRNTIAAYFAVLLCISQSLFTIKTAALLWFLLGVLSVAKDVAPRVVPTRQRT